MLLICLFLTKKQNKTTTKKKKKVSPGNPRPSTYGTQDLSGTQDLRRIKRTHYLLRHATIAKEWMSNLTSLCPQDKFLI